MQQRRGHILSFILFSALTSCGISLSANAQEPPADEPGEVASTGSDVIVSSLQFSQVISHGYQNTLTGYVTGLSIGTSSCSVGTEPVQWKRLPSVQHPVIRSSMYRLKNGRFEQIGLSWVKHGFFATNESLCNATCTVPPQHDGSSLYPGCGDPYFADLNGNRIYLGPSSDVNAFTGSFPSNVTQPPNSGHISGRLQVHNVDLDPALNSGARYFLSAQYIAADDAADGNALNNASYQRAVISLCPGTDPQRFCVNYADFLHDQESPIHAWKEFEPNVVETEAPVPGEGRFTLAAKVTDLGTGFWHYEYALQNLNSDRSARAFTMPVAEGASVLNVGFHDVEYHSGEPFDNTDWSITVLPGKIIWSGPDHSANPNGNALRWGTIYNFRFDSNAPPTSVDNPTTVSLDLFKPGAPTKINISTMGPLPGLIDCQPNGIADLCDVNCDGLGCGVACGASDDCNTNGVPDECENDCNENGIADTCDLVPQGESEDCNSNTVPDECEEDCNENGIPDTCETVHDCDDDGVNDCDDLCQCSTPPNGCASPSFVCCYNNGFLTPNFPYNNCLSDQGTPLCHPDYPGSCEGPPLPCPTTTCRQGCMVGDGDGDGDFDLNDFNQLLQCYSGEEGSPAFVQPSSQCRTWFDYDDNNAVDLADVEQFRRDMAGPDGN